MNRSILSRVFAAGLAAVIATAPSLPLACTRLVYLGANGQVITARSMDWRFEMPTNLWISPRGMARSGEVGPNSLQWKSRYGSVIASAYEVSTSDGMNEAGLVANVLWLTESEYPKFDSGRPGLSIAAWAQYVLDNFATVQEAVETLEKDPFTIVTDNLPGQKVLTTLHLSISDATGDSAIVEYIHGKPVILVPLPASASGAAKVGFTSRKRDVGNRTVALAVKLTARAVGKRGGATAHLCANFEGLIYVMVTIIERR